MSEFCCIQTVKLTLLSKHIAAQHTAVQDLIVELLRASVCVEMNSELDYGGSSSSGNGKLRQWLIEQVDCGKYPGLVWENDEKTIFRIPWKHAGKQDYNRDEDAALFKVKPPHPPVVLQTGVKRKTFRIKARKQVRKVAKPF